MCGDTFVNISPYFKSVNLITDLNFSFTYVKIQIDLNFVSVEFSTRLKLIF